MRPLSFGEILDVGIKIFTRNATTLLKLVAIIIIPVQIISALIIFSTGVDPNDPNSLFSQSAVGEVELNTGNIYRWSAAFVALIVVNFIATSLATAACYKAVGDAYLGHKPGWRESLGYGFRRLHSVIWVTFLIAFFSVAIGGSAAVLLGVMTAAIGEAGALIGILLLFGVVPLIVWLYNAWAVSVPALLTEGQRGSNALKRSFRLVRGRWWLVFGVMFVTSLIAGVVSMIITGIPAVALRGGLGDSELAEATINAFAGGVASILTTPFIAAVTVVLYFDLRVRKEGFDLHLLAQQMGTEAPESLPDIFPAPYAPYPPPPPGSYLPPGAGAPTPYPGPPGPPPGYPPPGYPPPGYPPPGYPPPQGGPPHAAPPTQDPDPPQAPPPQRDPDEGQGQGPR